MANPNPPQGLAVRELDELVERGGSAAVVDRRRGGGQPFGEIRNRARGDQPRRGVEHDDVAMRPGLAGQHGPGGRDVAGRVAAAQRRRVGALDAVGSWVELVAAELTDLTELDDSGRR
ncbi:MAG: hypothetical protein QOG30_868, partial [Acidimicrobiaceae bacterium]